MLRPLVPQKENYWRLPGRFSLLREKGLRTSPRFLPPSCLPAWHGAACGYDSTLGVSAAILHLEGSNSLNTEMAG